MKGISVLVTIVLLVLAQQLAWRLRSAGALPVQKESAPNRLAQKYTRAMPEATAMPETNREPKAL